MGFITFPIRDVFFSLQPVVRRKGCVGGRCCLVTKMHAPSTHWGGGEGGE